MKSNKRFHLILLVMLLSILIWSVIEPKDLFIWFLEVLPVIIGVAVLIYIYPKYRFSNFIYVLITI